MRIDFSEPECRNCYHCRTSRILNIQASEPSTVIGSSVTSMPFSFGPVQALGHDSVAVGSTSTSSPVQALGHDSAAVVSTSTSSPVQALGHDSAAVGSTSTSSPVQAHGHDSAAVVSTSTSSPVHSSSAISFGSPPVATTLVNSRPAQSVAPAISNDGTFWFPSQGPAFQVPVQATSGSGASATSTSLTSSPLHSSSPFGLGSAPAATTSVSSGPTQALTPATFQPGSIFQAPVQVNSGSGASHAPATFQPGSIFQAPVQVNSGSGASATCTYSTSSPLHSSSPFGFSHAVTSVSSAPTQALGPTTFGYGAFSAPTPPRFGTMHDPVQGSASSSSPSFSFGPAHSFGQPASASLFGNNVALARPDVGISPLPSFSNTTAVFDATPVSVSSPFGPAQAPVQASASSTSTFLPFGCVPASPASGSSLFTSAFGSPPALSSSNFFGPNSWTSASVLDTPTESVNSQFGSKSGLNSFFPGFGVGYLPGSSSNLFRPNPPNFGGGSIGAVPQPFGFNGATTMLPSSPFSSSATFSSIPDFGPYPFASNEWSCRTEQGSRCPGYAPTLDGQSQKGDIYISISASNPYLHKSHEELRWEDYKQGDKGGLFPAAHFSPIGSRPDTVFSPSTVSPPLFASRSIPDYAFSTTGVGFGPFPGGTTPSSIGFDQLNAPFPGFVAQFPSSSSPSSTAFPPISSSVQRPHETAAVSFPAPGCASCGATTSPFASGHFTFNGATTPPSAASTPPGMFFSTTGFDPMMFGTTLAVQGTTPALQAYPVQGYILLPFAAMSLQ